MKKIIKNDFWFGVLMTLCVFACITCFRNAQLFRHNAVMGGEVFMLVLPLALLKMKIKTEEQKQQQKRKSERMTK